MKSNNNLAIAEYQVDHYPYQNRLELLSSSLCAFIIAVVIAPQHKFWRTATFKPGLALFCWGALFWAACLLFAGGFTTSIHAGMAFLDWPLSNGSLNPKGWLEAPDQVAEHSHRLLGMKVGLLSLIIVIWTFLRESRWWVRRLAQLLLGVVILQGLLGGARVLCDTLNIGSEGNTVAQAFAVMHACGAQLFLCLLVSITLTQDRSWWQAKTQTTAAEKTKLRRSGWVLISAIVVQLLVGAIMRHNDAGLAMPTFPLTPEGLLWPAAWGFQVSIHFAHRVGAVVVMLIVLHVLGLIVVNRNLRQQYKNWALMTGTLLTGQIFLGAQIIWTCKNPHIATWHMLIGAFLLAWAWMLVFSTYRDSLKNFSEPTHHCITSSQPALAYES